MENNKNIEIERKYLLKRLPENLDDYPVKIIEQGYLNTEPVVRVRRANDKYILTIKGRGLMARTEYNIELDEDSYNHLIKKSDGNIISKKRYIIPLENPCFGEKSDIQGSSDSQPDSSAHISAPLTIELDVFEPPFAPLIMAEVEFPDIETANAFVAPEWFGEEVTNDFHYHNSYMSRQKL